MTTNAERKHARRERLRQLNRRVDIRICEQLALKRERIIAILEEYGLESISLTEVKGWRENPQEASPVWKALLAASSRKRQADQDKAEQKVFTAAVEEDLAKLSWDDRVHSLQQKLQGGSKRFSHDEEDMLDQFDYDLARDLVDQNPANVVLEYADDELAQLVAKHFKIDFTDHRTYPAHWNRCDQQGKEDSCAERVEHQAAEEREAARLKSGLKEIEVLTSDVQLGDHVLFYWESKLGIVQKVNKISYTIKGTGNASENGLMHNYRMDPHYVQKRAEGIPSFEVGYRGKVKCADSRVRECTVVEKQDDIFYLVEYVLKSKKETKYCWVDCLRFVDAEVEN